MKIKANSLDTTERMARARARRRKTLFPLSGKEVCAERVKLAGFLSRHYSAHCIRQILNLRGPDEARRLVAKSRRSEVGGQGRTI